MVRFELQPSYPDIFVTDEAGRDAYWVHGPTGRVGRWSLRSLAGGELAAVLQHGSPFLQRFGIYQRGRLLAVLRELPSPHVPRLAAAAWNALAGAPRRIRYAVDTCEGELLWVEGDATRLEYGFTRAGRRTATVSTRWLASAAACGVAVTLADPADTLLVLAATAAIESSWGRMRYRA